MSQRNLEPVIAALVMRLGGRVCLSNEEIEDAQELDIRSLFETDQVELKAKKEFKNPPDTSWIKGVELGH